jgi:excisionase family DNA binding protein
MSDLTTRDVAVELRCTPGTVRGLIQSHELRAYRINDGGPYRVTPEALAEFRAQREAERQDPWTRSQDRRKSA